MADNNYRSIRSGFLRLTDGSTPGSKSKGLSEGALAGIIIAVVAVVVLFATVFGFALRRRRKRRAVKEQSVHEASVSTASGWTQKESYFAQAKRLVDPRPKQHPTQELHSATVSEMPNGERLVRHSQAKQVDVTLVATLVVVARLEEGTRRGERLVKRLELAIVDLHLQHALLVAHLVREARADGHIVNRRQVLSPAALSRVRDADDHVAVGLVVDLGQRLVVVGVAVGLEDLADADLREAVLALQVDAEAVGAVVGRPVDLVRAGLGVDLVELGAAVLALGVLDAVRVGGRGRLHDERAILGLGEEVLEARVLVAIAALEIAGGDRGRAALLGPDGQLQLPKAKVEVPSWSAGGIEFCCGRRISEELHPTGSSDLADWEQYEAVHLRLVMKLQIASPGLGKHSDVAEERGVGSGARVDLQRLQ
ncbi:hypothetical protein FH972_021945 [Carpinus fangiana]|uniref:Uncharacterized protein n=1 Tax=Carpinus fangiana TaxID=176857 RepID=A0A5N6KQS8_9ROSI|nr:hypothetical protein FH972_021945 [Carpinus fangiana]